MSKEKPPCLVSKYSRQVRTAVVPAFPPAAKSVKGGITAAVRNRMSEAAKSTLGSEEGSGCEGVAEFQLRVRQGRRRSSDCNEPLFANRGALSGAGEGQKHAPLPVHSCTFQCLLFPFHCALKQENPHSKSGVLGAHLHILWRPTVRLQFSPIHLRPVLLASGRISELLFVHMC